MPIEDLTSAVRRLDQNTDRVIKAQQMRTLIFVIFGALLLVAFVGGFFVSQYRINKNAEDIQRQLLSDCQVAKDIGESDLPSSASTLGRKIVLDFRDAYNSKCAGVYGPLKPIDKDILTPSPSSTRSAG